MKDVQEIIEEVIKEYNESAEKPVDLSKGADTVLFGTGGAMDSLALVTTVVDIEQAVEDEYGKSIMLASPKAMSQKHSPFRTVGSLTAYVKELLAEA